MHRTLYPAMWYALANAKVSPEAKLVFIFAECGPTAHPTGLYSLPILDICNGTGLPEKAVLRAIQELEGASLFLYDRARMLVFIPGALRRQFFIKTGIPNEKQTKGILAHLEHLSHSSPAVQAFMRENSLLLPDGSDLTRKAHQEPPSDAPTGNPHPEPPSGTTFENPDTPIGNNRDLIQRPETETRGKRSPRKGGHDGTSMRGVAPPAALGRLGAPEDDGGNGKDDGAGEESFLETVRKGAGKWEEQPV